MGPDRPLVRYLGPDPDPLRGYVVIEDLPTAEMRESLRRHCLGRSCITAPDGADGVWLRDYREWAVAYAREAQTRRVERDRAILLAAWALREPDLHRDSHRLIDLRSLAFHRMGAVRMRSDPRLFEQSRGILDRWMERVDNSARPLLTQWARLMDQGMEVALKVAEEDSERSAQLRQSSPLVCGVLSEPERHWLLREWRRLVNELPGPTAAGR